MDQGAPQTGAPPTDDTTDRVAECRPDGRCWIPYAEAAPRLLDNGYEPLPLYIGKKRPVPSGWQNIPISAGQVATWCRRLPGHGVGLRAGGLVGVDIDVLDPDIAHAAAVIVRARLGDLPMRVGRWPKRLFICRTSQPFRKKKAGTIEILGIRNQFVVFGKHPDTGRGYYWPGGETPLDIPFDQLPCFNEATFDAVLAELAALTGTAVGRRRGTGAASGRGGGDITRDTTGLVIDGRDYYLSVLAFHAVHDAIDRGDAVNPERLAGSVWDQFAATTDLNRPKHGGDFGYELADALAKLRDKARMLQDGVLPERGGTPLEPDYLAPTNPVEIAREELEVAVTEACDEIRDWLRSDRASPAPQIGIRATVGLGKSTVARKRLLGLRAALAGDGLPSRLLILTPSHSLADEVAEAWTADGASAAVLRGYEAHHPVHRAQMCRVPHLVRAVAAAGLDIQSSLCERSGQQKCRFFDSCLKQQNRRDVSAAEVVVAAYDILFTGFAGVTDSFAMVMIDEAFWQRSVEQDEIALGDFPHLGLAGIRAGRQRDRQGAALADLSEARARFAAALVLQGPGPILRQPLVDAGITEQFCHDALASEHGALPDPQLVPGQSGIDQDRSIGLAGERAQRLRAIGVWTGALHLLAGETDDMGQLRLLPARPGQATPTMQVARRRPMNAPIASLPILHLDATLRPDLVKRLLPEIRTVTIDADAPNQHVRLIAGRFSKSTLLAGMANVAEPTLARSSLLDDCVAYVRWHAARHATGRVLVVTHKDCEPAFAGLANVETAHFNAVAGLDVYRDVGALIIIGRPLPSTEGLLPLLGALYEASAKGGYAWAEQGLWLRSGRKTGVRVVRHQDPRAEVLRAAICDDEVMQSLGRGRGVNRTASNPLEVHLMSDVALPLSYDQVLSWDAICPDIVQHMLLAGLAVDSPGDALQLHPGLFGTAEQAEKAFQRAGFGGQSPIRDTYREMSAKSASYRKGGRGYGRQRAYWIEGSAENARAQLEAAIGPVAEWQPQV